MAGRRLLTDDVRMVWIAELSDAAREQTVVCGLDADSENEPIRFAACLARRLGWRLSLVPLPDAATEDERLERLMAATTSDGAGLVVTKSVGRGTSAASLVELSCGAGCPLIAVPRGAPALGTGPVLCGIAGDGHWDATALAASRLASAIGARLVLADCGSQAMRLGDLARRESAALLAVGAPGDLSPDSPAAAALRDAQVPVMVVPGDAAGTRDRQAA